MDTIYAPISFNYHFTAASGLASKAAREAWRVKMCSAYLPQFLTCKINDGDDCSWASFDNQFSTTERVCHKHTTHSIAMASSALCTACRQALRQEVGQLRRAQAPYQTRTKCSKILNPSRSFTTRHSLSAAQTSTKQKAPAPRPHSGTPNPSKIAPQIPQKAEQSSPAAEIPPQTPPKEGSATAAFLENPTRTIAKELRKRATNTTETYVAYGVCEKLVRECARQADYTIPQARDKNAEIPKTKDGEDLGVGTGWWYESKHTSLLRWLSNTSRLYCMCTNPSPNSPQPRPNLHSLVPNNLPAHVSPQLPSPVLPPHPRPHLATASPRPLLLHSRRSHGPHAQHRRQLHPPKISQRPLSTMARAISGI